MMILKLQTYVYICLVQTNFSYSHGQLKSIAEKQIHIVVPLMKCVQHWFSYEFRNQLKKFFISPLKC